MFQYTRRWLTGREYSLSSFRPLISLMDCLPLLVQRVASSSAAIGKRSHLAFVSRSSAHRGGLDEKSMRDTDTTQSSSTNMVNCL